jgi:class 3 adenylate cyclase
LPISYPKRNDAQAGRHDPLAKRARERASWPVILAEIAAAYALIYISAALNWPHHEYFRFLSFLPLYQAAASYGYSGGIIGGFIVSLLFLPVIPRDPFIVSDPYGVQSAVVMLLLINAFGITVGGIIGRNRRTRRHVHRLSELSMDIARETNARGVMRRLAADAMDLVEARRAALLIRNAESEDPALWDLFVFQSGAPESVTGFSPDHVLAWCARERQVLAGNGVSADPRFRLSATGGAVQSLLAVPVMSEDAVCGALLVADKSTADQFTHNDLSMVRLLARSAAAAIGNLEQERRRQEESLRADQMKELFGRFVSSSVADYVLENPELLEGRWQEVTVLVSDIRDFTSISETLSPRQIVDQLNEYFTCMVDIIFEYSGAIDKFIGDCIIAYWGAPAPDPDHARHAAQAAVAMAAALDDLNDRWLERGRPRFHVCIGINTGNVVAGNIGSIRRMEYTVIGDTGNVAARIKALSSKHNIPVLVSDSTRTRLSGDYPFTETLQAAVKGKTGAITVHWLAVAETMEHNPEANGR